MPPPTPITPNRTPLVDMATGTDANKDLLLSRPPSLSHHGAGMPPSPPDPDALRRRREAQLILEQHLAGREHKCSTATAEAERRSNDNDAREREMNNRELELRRREERIKAAEEGWKKGNETVAARGGELDDRERAVHTKVGPCVWAVLCCSRVQSVLFACMCTEHETNEWWVCQRGSPTLMRCAWLLARRRKLPGARRASSSAWKSLRGSDQQQRRTKKRLSSAKGR